MKKVISFILSSIMALSSLTMVAYAAPTQQRTNVNNIGTTSRVQMTIIEGYGKYITQYIRYFNYGDNEAVKAIEDFFYNQVPQVTDLKSENAQIARALAVANVYDTIARYPESYDLIIEKFESLVGKKQENPSPKVQGAIAYSYYKLIESMARQPEMANKLLEANNILNPKITDLNCEEVQISRAKALSALYESVARQPEMETTLVATFKNLLGSKIDNPSTKVQAAIMTSYDGYIEATFRQPEIKQDLDTLMVSLSPNVTDFDSDDVQTARANLLSTLYENFVRFYDIKDDIKSTFLQLAGPKKENPSVNVQAAALASNIDIIKGILREPTIKEELLALKEEVSPNVTDYSDELVQFERATTSNDFYKMLISIPAAEYDNFVALFTELMGEKVDTNSPLVQGAVAHSLGAYLKYHNRNSELAPLYEKARQELFQQITDFNLEQVQIGRAKAINELYDALPSVLTTPGFMAKFGELLGEKVATHAFIVSFNTMGANEIENRIVYHDTKIEQPKDVTKDGYKLVNWKNGDEVFDFNTPITENITLNANWESISNTNDNTNMNNNHNCENIEENTNKIKSPNTGNESILFILSIFALGLGVMLTNIKAKRYE